MADQDEDDIEENLKLLAQGIVEALFRAYIEDGSIQIEGRNPKDIFEEFKAQTDKVIRGEVKVKGIRDHRDTLLERAKSEAESEHNEVAIVLYATWIEHSINGMLTLALERNGYTAEVITPLMRELRLQTKASALWKIAGLREIGEENLKFLAQVIEFRNSLVHYKWPAHDWDLLYQRSFQLGDIIGRIDTLIDVLVSIEEDTFWNGRETELIEYFRQNSRPGNTK